MFLICLNCGNAQYFETDLALLQALTVRLNGTVGTGPAKYQGDDWAACSLHDQLKSKITFDERAAGCFDAQTTTYHFSHIRCARCGSDRVCPPQKQQPQALSLAAELEQHRAEYRTLRKERKRYANSLP